MLVHGTTADHTRWNPLRSAFEDHFTVYALYLEAEDVAAVVDSIDESVVLLGHSFGAICSLEAAL